MRLKKKKTFIGKNIFNLLGWLWKVFSLFAPYVKYFLVSWGVNRKQNYCGLSQTCSTDILRSVTSVTLVKALLRRRLTKISIISRYVSELSRRHPEFLGWSQVSWEWIHSKFKTSLKLICDIRSRYIKYTHRIGRGFCSPLPYQLFDQILYSHTLFPRI